jgi:hypothetical protein
MRTAICGPAARISSGPTSLPAVVLSRPETGELRIVRRLSDRKLFLYDRLVIPGTGGWMNLRWFSTRAVRQACLARGWRFDGAS